MPDAKDPTFARAGPAVYPIQHIETPVRSELDIGGKAIPNEKFRIDQVKGCSTRFEL